MLWIQNVIGKAGMDRPTSWTTQTRVGSGSPWFLTFRCRRPSVETFTVGGSWRDPVLVADTEQHGICAALRLPDGTWAGRQHNGQVGGSMPGCRPTRAQLSGGALALDGFDHQDSAVIDSSGKPWLLDYGVVTAAGHATQVRDTVSGTSTRVVDGSKSSALAVRPIGKDWGDDIHLNALEPRAAPPRKAFDASGRITAAPLPLSTRFGGQTSVGETPASTN